MPSMRYVMPALVALGCTAYAAAPKRAAPARSAPAAKAPQQQVSGPIASYWMSVATSSGFGFGTMGQGAAAGQRPSLGQIMRMMRGGNGAPVHDLTLQLGSSQPPVGAARADHLPGTGAGLPLLTPRIAPPASATAETTEDQPAMPERPKGRILLYWGCGEHAGPGQPIELDFSKLLDGQPMPRLPYVAVHRQNPPSPGRYATYGEWPAGQRNARPPASLVGGHQVRGTYSPDIAFQLPADRDWMAPLGLDASTKTPAGATALHWNAVPGATGYFAMMFGAAVGGARGDTPTVVMWSSSTVATFAGGGLLDYLAPAEVRRLIAARAVLPPEQTQCAVPAEVAKPGQFGMISLIGYGPEVDVSDPPRPADPRIPWNIRWAVKARYKTTASVMLGIPGTGGGGGAATSDDQGASPRKRSGLLGKLKDAAEGTPR